MFTMSWQWPKLKTATFKCEKRVTFENVFKAVVLLMVWGLFSFSAVVFAASKEQSTSSDWLDTISMLLQSLEGNCADRQENTISYNGTELNGTLTQDCSISDSASQVSVL